MSSSNNAGGLQSIPTASRKMVQSLKEIINCSELEIYAILKDCNMDPNEAVFDPELLMVQPVYQPFNGSTMLTSPPMNLG
ncbi:hypothetical protein LOK49_LG11G02384 [Camellia lanceoleosa]|uniref:Uncharacterized protein n=1 Tax=Camellia lanceoleosa TaxID=1840588 RepID=A0ACC0G0V7_9ERIC|nr:hypothetical protein LOK49_LG11G02384 [Camellia lanceoleosa]